VTATPWRGSSRTHYQQRADRYRTLCGRVTLRYAGNGSLVSQLTVTSDPKEVTCVICRWHPELTGEQGEVPP
jgi:hypothetical protein